jgi:Ca2+-binding EF-hand superfamily protein
MDKMTKEIAIQCFKKYDKNNNGSIETNEFTQLMNGVCNKLGIDKPLKEELDDIFTQSDLNKDNVLSEEEFLELYEVFIKMREKK